MESGWLIACKRARPRGTMRSVLAAHLPDRLAGTLAERLGLDGELANISDRSLVEAERRLAGWSFSPNGTAGFAKAEVTAGGFRTRDLSSPSMQAKRLTGQYVICDAAEVTGWPG